MKDIKTLYLTAKSSGKQADINAYTESIEDLINNDPNSYISHLEYIIQSDIGLKTLKPFIEKNGLPLVCYDNVIKCLNECVRKCEVYNKDASLYIEAIKEFQEFRNEYLNCFMMFENYNLDINNDEYIKTYYGKNKDGYQNRKLVAGMINRFGEAAIPDAFMTAESISDDAVKTVLEFISNKYNENCATLYEWVLTACNNINNINKSYEELLNHINENCLSAIVENIKNKEHQVFRESMIMDKLDLFVEYTEDEINAIQELIMFKEYQMTWIENEIKQESVTNLQNEIYDLYEMLDGLIEEDVADSVIEMLPGSNNKSMKESLAIVNTRNKKTGEIPAYLANNHDIHYGEEEPDKKKDEIINNTSNKETDPDDYRRPSAHLSHDTNNDTGSVLNLPSAYNSDNEPQSSSSTTSRSVSEEDKRIINNYYYTYTNSLNKNSNSYNKDHSVKDNHSVHKDDNSKTINSNNVTKPEYSLIDDSKSEEKVNVESIDNQWKLTIFNDYNVFNESEKNAKLDKPKSDHPIKDILTDIDRNTTKKQQEAKKKIQDTTNVAKVALKPVNRTKSWINNLVHNWKDADENNVKERMADPKTRSNLFTAIKHAIIGGSLLKAGILLNPVFLFLSITRGVGKNKKTFRIRNEMIGEIKTEIAIIDEKIKDANSNGDNAEKYKLMRFKNELNKKLIRVGGTKEMSKMI